MGDPAAVPPGKEGDRLIAAAVAQGAFFPVKTALIEAAYDEPEMVYVVYCGEQAVHVHYAMDTENFRLERVARAVHRRIQKLAGGRCACGAALQIGTGPKVPPQDGSNHASALLSAARQERCPHSSHEVAVGSDGYVQPVADLGEDARAEVVPAQAPDPAVDDLGAQDVLDRLGATAVGRGGPHQEQRFAVELPDFGAPPDGGLQDQGVVQRGRTSGAPVSSGMGRR
ncbi:hypothetical protein ACFWIN_05745 [Streptomyces sp. NPDC127049]|uniref:hypothetical protein n=1 Tax=Streptomyces sp. NPDC127049 TaxID=3347118 RepID=UPI0036614365